MSGFTFGVFIACFAQILQLLTGGFVEVPAKAWLLPVLTILLARKACGPRLTALALSPLGLGILSTTTLGALATWHLSGLSPYLPHPGSGAGLVYALTMSLPLAVLAFVLLDYWDSSGVPNSSLPKVLRAPSLILGTALFIFVSGMTLTLPVGPLSDEGMISFMEGGCDWGGSNVFFFSRLGLLIAMNFAVVVLLRHGVPPLKRFTPHFAAAALLIWWTYDSTYCDDYWYGHPQGNIGQTLVEMVAFALLGFFVARASLSWRPWQKLVAVLAWNGLYVAAFQVGQAWTPHWTWTHTFSVSGVLSVSALLIACFQAVPRKR